MTYAIGIDLGATNIKTLAVDEHGDVLDEHSQPTEDGPDNKWASNVRHAVDTLEENLGRASCIGVCCPGLIYPDERAVSWMVDRMTGTVDFEWQDFLKRERKVPVLNDGQAALLGEVWRGAAQGMQNVVALTLGTGVGGAIMVDGKLLKGHIGRAGQLGHVGVDASADHDLCNMPGGLDIMVGNATVAGRTAERFSDTAALVSAFEAGDKAAREPWLAALHHLACGIASIINTVDPEAVIIGGGIAHAGDALFGPLGEAMARVEWRPNGHRVPIIPARLGAHAGAMGAAWNAMQHLH